MSKLKEYYGYYCESEYESNLIDFLANEVWKYRQILENVFWRIEYDIN